MASKTPTTTNQALPSVPLSENGRLVLERRYMAKDDAGNLVETPEQLFRRVADNVAGAEARYQPESASPAERESAVARHADAFYDLMTSCASSPTHPPSATPAAPCSSSPPASSSPSRTP